MINIQHKKTAIVVGAGIAGLATARALAIRGYKVTVIEKTTYAVGASIRNFGMIWPIGQPDGELYETAILSKAIWKQVCTEANIWHDEVGSMHVAHTPEEWTVLQELHEVYQKRNYQLLSKNEVLERSPFTVAENLSGGLYSEDEMIVDPRKAIKTIPVWLNEKYNVEFVWGKAASRVADATVFSGTEKWEAELIFICSGADFETLYPEIYAAQPITKCKLQMMRLGVQPANVRIGPALCGGLSLIHYNSFKAAGSLPALRAKLDEKYPDYIKWGIHVMASQNQEGMLTIGDSHEYGLTHDPFDKTFINKLVLNYLSTFAHFPGNTVAESWNGIYPKLTNGQANMILQVNNGIYIINGLGGAGMTLSFGVCENVIGNI